MTDDAEAIGAIAAGLTEAMLYALKRGPAPQTECVRAGAGCTADLVGAGLAKWAGPSTWRAKFTPLGLRVKAHLERQS